MVRSLEVTAAQLQSAESSSRLSVCGSQLTWSQVLGHVVSSPSFAEMPSCRQL